MYITTTLGGLKFWGEPLGSWTQLSNTTNIGPLAVEWLAAGSIVAVFGALVKFAGWTWLLAGYSESTSPIPDDVVQDIAGNTLLRVGIAVTGFGVLASVTDPPSYRVPIIELAILVVVLRLLYRLNTWSPTQAV